MKRSTLLVALVALVLLAYAATTLAELRDPIPNPDPTNQPNECVSESSDAWRAVYYLWQSYCIATYQCDAPDGSSTELGCIACLDAAQARADSAAIGAYDSCAGEGYCSGGNPYC